MKVTLIAQTRLSGPTVDEQLGYADPTSEVPEPADTLAEFTGRLCYQSWHKPNPDTRTNAGYLANIVRRQHFSVLEHASASFLLEDVSRSLTHELVRHRHGSYSQLSQRYVDQLTMSYVVPPDLAEDEEAKARLAAHFAACQAEYAWHYERARARGLGVKPARGLARAVMPEMTATSIVVTGNLAAWREILRKRLSKSADIEIRTLAEGLLEHLRVIAPNTFADIILEPQS